VLENAALLDEVTFAGAEPVRAVYLSVEDACRCWVVRAAATIENCRHGMVATRGHRYMWLRLAWDLDNRHGRRRVISGSCGGVFLDKRLVQFFIYIIELCWLTGAFPLPTVRRQSKIERSMMLISDVTATMPLAAA